MLLIGLDWLINIKKIDIFSWLSLDLRIDVSLMSLTGYGGKGVQRGGAGMMWAGGVSEHGSICSLHP